MTLRDCVLLPLSFIRPTEETCADRVDEVVAMIRQARAWTRPICIERSVGALLDGHHRLAAARRLGLARVPVHVFDYAEVELASWQPSLVPTRDEVLARALSGELYPIKTTRHAFTVAAIRPIPLSVLVESGGERPGSLEPALRARAAILQAELAIDVKLERRRG